MYAGAPIQMWPPALPADRHMLRAGGRDLQICIDLLRSNGHPDVRADSQGVACYISCCDVEYASQWHYPRLGNGSFTIALEAIYEQLYGEPLQKTLFGRNAPPLCPAETAPPTAALQPWDRAR